MTPKPSLYIGNGFIDSQLFYIIPLADGYSKRRGINRWVVERPIPDVIMAMPSIVQIISKYEIKVVHYYSRSRVVRFWHFLNAIVGNAGRALCLAHKVDRTSLLEDVPWFECQLRHAVWDQALQKSADGTINPSFLLLLPAALRVLVAAKRAKFLVDGEGVCAAIIGHTVYAGRALLAVMRRSSVDILAHAANVLYRLPEPVDSSWSRMLRKEWDNSIRCIRDDNVRTYWEARSRGYSSYQDASTAATRVEDVTSTTPKNLLLLHVFRDSPFNSIDRSRIFADYVEWIEKTLHVLAASSEEWIFKTHPSALRWGENQHRWLGKIANRVFGKNWPDHIRISDAKHSNIDLFRHASRVVTYHGTSHLEAACWGIKPIVISDVTLGSYSADLVFKPKKFLEYSKLLLTPSVNSIFVLSEDDKILARKILYIREEFLSFARDVGTITTYRGDSEAMIRSDLESVAEKIEHAIPGLLSTGELLAEGLPRSVSLKYITRWNDSFKEMRHSLRERP